MLRSPKPVVQTPAAATTVVLTGGGSGGHITPLLPLARALKKAEPECRIIYIGLKGDKIEGLQNDYKIFDKVYYVNSGKFRRYHGESLLSHVADIKSLVLNFRDLFKVITGTISSRRLLKKLRPDVVFSKGGYVVVPVGLAARMLHIPIVTHDSDAVAGMANRIVGRWAKVRATGMPPAYYDYPKNEVAYVGIPISEDIGLVTEADQHRLKKALGIPPDSLVLLISGGGLGSKRVNDLVLQIAPQLLRELPNLYIIHITGDLHEEAVKAQYRALPDEQSIKRVKILGFSDEFSKNSGAADLVIARAGATTLAELELQKKACIIIPAPFLAGGHQLKNAEVLKRAEAAVIVNEDIRPQDLLKLVLDLLKDDARRHQLAAKMATLAHPRAADELAEIILNVAHSGRG